MRYYFFDSSALVKIYASEPGSDVVREIRAQSQADPPTTRIIACHLAYPETASAISAKERGGHLRPAVATQLLKRLAQDFMGPTRPYVVLEANSMIMNDAAGYTRTHGLRGYDSVHFAMALAARASAPPKTDFHFVTSDGQLVRAGQIEGFQVIELPPWQPIPKRRKKQVPAGGA